MMRTVLISLAAAASTLAVASPASAQAYGNLGPAYGAPGYGAPGYGAPGYGQHFGHVRGLQARLDHLQREIHRLAQFRMISRDEYRNLRRNSREIERSLRRNARDGYGLNPREVQNVHRQIARLEYRIARDVRDGRRWAHRWDFEREYRNRRWDD